MSVYLVRGKGWRYDFILQGTRYSSDWYKTKGEAKRAEAKRKEELLNPPDPATEIPTVMGFLELVNKRLDHVKAYHSESHFRDHLCMARRWVKKWGGMSSDELTGDDVEEFILERRKVSPYAANRELRCLRALFNFAIKREWLESNPTKNIPFLPVEKKVKYVPPMEDVLKVILAADPETQDYLWTVKETMGRMSEVNRLTWQDVNFEERCVVLYTRKKRGGHLTPRKVPMTNRLYSVLSHRYTHRDKTKPWVFWHRYQKAKTKEWVEGPYIERKKIMITLCKKVGVKYFRYHALRHFGASVLDRANVNIGAIQRILGHENRTTTEIYLHSIGEAEREAMLIYEQVTDESHTTPTQVPHKVPHRMKKDLRVIP